MIFFCLFQRKCFQFKNPMATIRLDFRLFVKNISANQPLADGFVWLFERARPNQPF